MGKLTAIQVQSLSALGLHGDGGTLYLRVAPGGLTCPPGLSQFL